MNTRFFPTLFLQSATPTLARRGRTIFALLLMCFFSAAAGRGQTPRSDDASTEAFMDLAQGLSASDLTRRALAANPELAAARLEIDRARARLRQAGLRPNPLLDLEQQNGVLNSPGERTTTVGVSIPLELAGQRGRRIDLAKAELEAAEAEIVDRERRLAGEVRAAYAEVLGALREIEVLRNLNTVDVETARIVEARVNEGDSAPLELNLMRTEVDRLQARSALVEGRLQAAMLRLKQLAGIPAEEPLRLREGLEQPPTPAPPGTLEAAIEIALRTRPDLRLARVAEEVADAGYRLARAQGAPQVTAFSRYADQRSSFDQTPVGAIFDRDRLLSFGLTISLPLFNRNQGTKAEAKLTIAQAQHRRESVESAVRTEAAAAYRRYEAAAASLRTYEQGVIGRSMQNVRTIRAAYETGAFRMSELLAEQRRLIDAQREATEAMTERYRALSDLLLAIGKTGIE